MNRTDLGVGGGGAWKWPALAKASKLGHSYTPPRRLLELPLSPAPLLPLPAGGCQQQREGEIGVGNGAPWGGGSHSLLLWVAGKGQLGQVHEAGGIHSSSWSQELQLVAAPLFTMTETGGREGTAPPTPATQAPPTSPSLLVWVWWHSLKLQLLAVAGGIEVLCHMDPISPHKTQKNKLGVPAWQEGSISPHPCPAVQGEDGAFSVFSLWQPGGGAGLVLAHSRWEPAEASKLSSKGPLGWQQNGTYIKAWWMWYRHSKKVLWPKVLKD